MRVALSRVRPRAAQPVEQPVQQPVQQFEPAVVVTDGDVVTPDDRDDDLDDDRDNDRDDDAAAVTELVVLACPLPRTAERAAARAGELVEAPVVVTEGAHLPLAGGLLALPALQMTGLLEVAEQTFPPMRKRATLLMGVFMALLREPRAEGGTRLRPADLGRLLRAGPGSGGQDAAPQAVRARWSRPRCAVAGFLYLGET